MHCHWDLEPCLRSSIAQLYTSDNTDLCFAEHLGQQLASGIHTQQRVTVQLAM